MQLGPRVTSSSSLKVHPQPDTAPLRDPASAPLQEAIVNPKWAMEVPLQTPQPPRTCGAPGPSGKSCWNLDARVALLLATVAGAVILLLLYRLLQLRHRLRLARAGHALEYFSFFHTATYTLKHPTPSPHLPTKSGPAPQTAPPVQTVSAVTPPVPAPPLPPPPASSPPLLPLPSPPALAPPPLRSPPPLPSASASASATSLVAFPLPLPLIHTTPPSPHLSWGACSDAELYSRIGAYRPSRLSSLSSHSKVILFEHSSL